MTEQDGACSPPKHATSTNAIVNEIHATGCVDGAARAARLADQLEYQKEFQEAVAMHEKAAQLYQQSAEQIKASMGAAPE